MISIDGIFKTYDKFRYKDRWNNFSVIDDRGKTIIPKSKYQYFSNFIGRYALVRTKKSKELNLESFSKIINFEGKELYSSKSNKSSIDNRGIKDDFLLVEEGRYSKLVDLRDTLNTSPLFEEVLNFQNNLTFGYIKGDSNYSLFDKNFKVIQKDKFDDFCLPSENSNFYFAEVVAEDDSEDYNYWVKIDQSGKIISRFTDDMYEIKKIISEDIILVDLDSKCKSGQYLLANNNGEIRFNKCIESAKLINSPFQIIEAKTRDSSFLLNKHMKIIWKEEIVKKIKRLNLDHVYEIRITVKNTKENNQNLNHENFNIEILNKTDTIRNHSDKFIGKKCNISNKSNKDLIVEDIYIQAKNNNKWVYITYPPQIADWHFPQRIKPRHIGFFSIPIFEGERNNLLRIEIQARYDNKNISIYSKEFLGSINPGQTWRIKNHKFH